MSSSDPPSVHHRVDVHTRKEIFSQFNKIFIDFPFVLIFLLWKNVRLGCGGYPALPQLRVVFQEAVAVTEHNVPIHKIFRVT